MVLRWYSVVWGKKGTFTASFKGETECFGGTVDLVGGTVDLVGGEVRDGKWLRGKGEVISGGSGGLGGTSPGMRDGKFRTEAPPGSCHEFCIGN
ncbi:hypothetical protein F2Q68_00026739 [Brassica cretica]|uniref:Uncharacterized protein n=1 Tax=Brassica cretica TaxID=69181 RepID=A0A8S9IK34_BRACR|nr:hypothetical protein F2Q68_00026739 [Brassica cretica]